jgi:hypothetical protein
VQSSAPEDRWPASGPDGVWVFIKAIEGVWKADKSPDVRKSNRYTITRWLLNKASGSTKDLTRGAMRGLEAWYTQVDAETLAREAKAVLRAAILADEIDAALRCPECAGDGGDCNACDGSGCNA